MTSHTNDSATKSFFEENDYFGYPKDCIKFFSQDQLPVVDIKGKILLAETYLIKKAPNGNGDAYQALLRTGLIEDMKARNIKWVFICGIDNILLRVVDPLFLGLTIARWP